MEFLIALFGGLYYAIRYLFESADRDAKMIREKKNSEKRKEIDELFGTDCDTYRKINSLHKFDGVELIRSNIDAIARANQYTTSNSIIRNYYYDLIDAKFGVFYTWHSYNLYGDKYDIAEKIEFCHQLEILLNGAGKIGEWFWYTPGTGVDINDEDQMCKGKIVMRCIDELGYKPGPYKRLW